MNYQKHNQKKKKPNSQLLLQFVGTQLVKNYSLDSPIIKLEFGKLKEYIKTEKINNDILINFN